MDGISCDGKLFEENVCGVWEFFFKGWRFGDVGWGLGVCVCVWNGCLEIGKGEDVGYFWLKKGIGIGWGWEIVRIGW